MNNELKNMIITKAEEISRNSGMDLDGDIFEVFGKKYYVDIINNKVEEVK